MKLLKPSLHFFTLMLAVPAFALPDPVTFAHDPIAVSQAPEFYGTVQSYDVSTRILKVKDPYGTEHKFRADDSLQVFKLGSQVYAVELQPGDQVTLKGPSPAPIP